MSRNKQRNPDFEFLMDDEGRDVFAYGDEDAPAPIEEPEAYAEYAEEAEEDLAPDMEYAEDYVEDYGEDDAMAAAPPAPAKAPKAAPFVAPAAKPAGSNLPLILGLLLTFAGIALGAAGSVGIVPKEVLARLVSLGLQPGLLFMTGIVLSGIGLGIRRSTQSSIDEFATRLSQEIDYLRAEVQTVTEQSNSARAAALAQSVEGVQTMMSKQESMLGNLTKATRMFNKPLMELASNVHDLDRKQEEVRRNVLAIEKAQSEDIASSERKFEGLVEQLHTHTVNVERSVTEAVRDEGKRILEQVGQVLEASKLFAEETGKRFQSLEDGMLDVLSEHSNTTTERFGEFADKVDAIEQQTRALSEREAPRDGLAELGAISSKLLELQAGLQELTRRPAPEMPPIELPELAQIERHVAEVHQALRELAARPVPTATPATSQAGSARAPSAPPPAKRPSASKSEADPLPSPISGTKPSETGGKVLSAIEKLKQLRGN